jgi:hypothetical protein
MLAGETLGEPKKFEIKRLLSSHHFAQRRRLDPGAHHSDEHPMLAGGKLIGRRRS